MKIKNIELNNFKCFKDLNLDLAPITILTGANSSGKSSFINSILGILQSVDFPYEYSLNGEYVQMGGFEDVFNSSLKNESTEKQFQIKFSLGSNSKTEFSFDTYWENSLVRRIPTLHSFEANYRENYSLKIKKNYSGYNFTADLNVSEQDRILYSNLIPFIAEQFEESKTQSKHIEKLTEQLKDINKPTISASLDKKSIKDIQNELRNNFLFNVYTNRQLEALQSFKDNTNYISSFRLHPQRTYYESSKSSLKVKGSGENYIDQIVHWKANLDERFDELNKIMESFGLLQEIEINRLQGGRYEILIGSKRKTTISPITDVGFGISQFLPIIVADLQLGKRSTLAISQPEIHLHPSVQAKFGNYIVKQMIQNEKNYIIETHSEYLINRLKLMVMSGELKEENVRIFHFENKEEGSILHKLQLTKKGVIEGAPQDFFDTYMIDVSAIMNQTFINAQND